MDKQEFSITIPFAGLNVKAQITIIPDKDPLIAFAQLDFGFLRVKGCTLKWKDFGQGGEPVLVFDLPAYRTAFKYVKAVYFPDTEQYKKLTEQIVNAVKTKLNINNDRYTNYQEEEINLDDIPI